MIADIAHSHVDAADVLFLIAAIVFAIACVINWVGGAIAARVNPLTLAFAGLALIAFAWLLL